MHTECTVMHNSTSSSMHNNPSVGKKQMSESFSEFSIIIFVYFTRRSFDGFRVYSDPLGDFGKARPKAIQALLNHIRNDQW